MRPLVPPLALLAALCIAGPAWAGISPSGAPTQDHRTAMRGPAPSAADKRASAKTPKPVPMLAAAKPAFSPLPRDVAQCRLDCARPYYFCLAAEQPDSCASSWVSCRAACETPAPTP